MLQNERYNYTVIIDLLRSGEKLTHEIIGSACPSNLEYWN